MLQAASEGPYSKFTSTAVEIASKGAMKKVWQDVSAVQPDMVALLKGLEQEAAQSPPALYHAFKVQYIKLCDQPMTVSTGTTRKLVCSMPAKGRKQLL